MHSWSWYHHCMNLRFWLASSPIFHIVYSQPEDSFFAFNTKFVQKYFNCKKDYSFNAFNCSSLNVILSLMILVSMINFVFVLMKFWYPINCSSERYFWRILETFKDLLSIFCFNFLASDNCSASLSRLVKSCSWKEKRHCISKS